MYDEAIAKYDARLRDDATFAIPPAPRLDGVSDFAEKDVAQLVEHGTDIKTNGKMFTVAEMHKTPPPQRRGIVWSDHINAILPDVPTPALDDVIKAALQATGNQWAVCFDLASSFELAEEVRPHYAFVIEVAEPSGGPLVKRGYTYKRLPLGTTFSPEVMQTTGQYRATPGLRHSRRTEGASRSFTLTTFAFSRTHESRLSCTLTAGESCARR